jgi:hypothetical protein
VASFYTYGLSLASEITWGAPQSITGHLSDFDTVGTPLYQWNGGGSIVTIDPTGINLTFITGTSLGKTAGDIDPHNRDGDNNYELLLSTISWADSTTSLSLTGLSVGHQYRLQLWMADTRSSTQGRQKTYSSGTGTSQITLDSGPPSQYVIGTFISDATTQTLSFIGSGAEHPQYNALALRTLGAPTPTLTSVIATDGTLSSNSGINIASGTSANLAWEFDNADSVTLAASGGATTNIAASGNTTVSPTITTTYTLTATNTFGSTVKTITVFVDTPIVAPRLNEIMADNANGLEDVDGNTEDWIELYNPNTFVIDAGNYQLTDDSSLTNTWAIPSGTEIPANGYLVIFASGKNRTGAELHTAFKLGSDGDYLAITNIDGSVVISNLPHDYPTNLLYPHIPEGKSYGYNDGGEIRFFAIPSPGESNGPGFLGFVSDTQFSHDRGFYDSIFNLVITSTTGTATIRYTTDSSAPTESTGIIYSGSIPISQTTVIRAIAYETGYESTNIDTHTYIFTPDVIAQADMDTAITQNGTYGPQMNDSLKALPIISLNIEDPDGVDNSTEHVTSVEMIFPDGTKGFQVDAGVSYFGGYFTDFDKKSFRLYFRKQYGESMLNFPLFEGFENGREHGILPVGKFDALDLRSGSHDMALRGAYLSNRFTDDSMLELGNISPHGRFVHIFRNGVYWGQYHLRERWSAPMGAEYLGGNKDSYEAINGNANVGGWSPGVAYDGDGSGWTYIKGLANSSTPWASLQTRVDMQSYIDFMLLYDFGSSENEYRSVLQPFDGGTKMRIYLNDADGYLNPTGIAQNNDAGGPGNLFGRLESENHQDFKTYLADRIYAAYFHDGAFAAQTNIERIQRRFDQTKLSFLCESARWGYRNPSSYNDYQNNLINSQFPGQTATRLTDLRNSGRYPSVDAPEYNQNGGVVSPGFGVFFTSNNGGTIYYTTDGSDPRLPGGSLNSSATALAGTGGSMTLLSTGSEWSYLDNGSNQGTAWREIGFNDSLWDSGNAELGYGDGGESTTLSFGSNSSDKFITTYFRKTFNVTNTAALTGLTLSLQRDDGAIVYLNGQEIVRSNMATGTANYNTLANVTVGGNDESAFTQYILDPTGLTEGVNTIAVEIHQGAVNSSDISFDLGLSATTGITAPDLTLTTDTTLKARVFSNGNWSAIHPATYVVSQPPVTPQPGHLVISELHYHPNDPTAGELASISTLDEDDFEFIEIMNIHSIPVRLDGCLFIDGIDYIFPEDSILQPGARLIVAKNLPAFSLRHPSTPAAWINGSFNGELDNKGERIILSGTSGEILIDLTYKDGIDRGLLDDALWPSKADGDGESLVMIHPFYGGNINNPLLWRASANNEGSPGNSDTSTLPENLIEDLDGDGFTALLERALHASDSNAAEQPSTVTSIDAIDDGTGSSQNHLTMTFTRDLLIEAYLQVETSSQLNTWVDNAVLVSRQFHNNGTETLKYRFPDPVSGTQQFMRIRVIH